VQDTEDAVGGTISDCGGKVSYLGGHSYLGKNGQRLFLNALFEAECTTNANWPNDPGVGPDGDGDGAPDATDPFPDDATKCGDSDNDGCDDCSSGSFSPLNDGPDENMDGICDAGEGGGSGDDGGCGCRTSGGNGAGLMLFFAIMLGALTRRRRKS
jgi:MYXO-CTERM domain-containing protein